MEWGLKEYVEGMTRDRQPVPGGPALLLGWALD